jgi:hypothetical protein
MRSNHIFCESHGDMRKIPLSLVEAKVYEHCAFLEVWIGDQNGSQVWLDYGRAPGTRFVDRAHLLSAACCAYSRTLPDRCEAARLNHGASVSFQMNGMLKGGQHGQTPLLPRRRSAREPRYGRRLNHQYVF